MYYIGLMSGTSTDAVDAVLADSAMHIIACASIDLPIDLRTELLALNSVGVNELARSALAANKLADIYSQAVFELLAKSGLNPEQIRAIGAHGQTIRHAPELGYTIQLNAPARIAEKTNIAVVADFRSRDIAAGGQGAPLVPAFHAALFGTDTNRIVLNLGGIANITVLDTNIFGFDTGPANMLLDAWINKNLGVNYDSEGAWGASGTPNQELLDLCLAEPWFNLPPPKSTGRDLFNLAWLESNINRLQSSISANDVQASLIVLSAKSIADAIQKHASNTKEIIVCGGGVKNKALINAINHKTGCIIKTSDDYGVPAQSVEALAFAWLAKANIDGTFACLPSVTGAKHASIAGCIYPA